MKNRIILLILISGLFLLTACNQTNASTDGATEWIVPKPKAGSGVLTGRMVGPDMKVDLNGIPFLSKLVTPGAIDVPPTVAFSVTYDPRGIVNMETGEFYFSDVVPGDNYVLAILSGFSELYVVREKNSENALILTVIAGETIDLGDVIVKTK
jgi:hypothetical protein